MFEMKKEINFKFSVVRAYFVQKRGATLISSHSYFENSKF